MKSKICGLCEEEKLVSLFYKSSKSIDGYNSRCKRCSRIKKCTETFYYERFTNKVNSLKNNEYQVLEYHSKKLRVKLLHKICGNVWDTLKSNVFTRECGHCNLMNKSSLSSRIERYLCLNNICYKTEYVFKDCRDKRNLPFDYAVFNCEKLLYLIEADGEQHFKETSFCKSTLEDIQRRDKIKNDYCKDNNIRLIRINFLQEEEVEHILNTITEKLDCNCDNEVKKYYTKSFLTERDAEIIRLLYLKKEHSVKSISRYLSISETPVTSIIKYKLFPYIREDLKELVDDKRKALQVNNRSFKTLTKEDIEDIIKLKKEGFKDVEIGKIYSVCRKSFPQFIKNWTSLSPLKKQKT